MIHTDKDPSLKSLLMQEALQARKLYTGALDNWWGPRSEDAYLAFLAAAYQAFPAALPEPSPRAISAAGLNLIKHFEGLYLKAYKDPVGIWTIGYGHTGLTHNDGTVKAGRVITTAEAEDLLRYDLANFEGRVSRLVTVPLSDDEHAALVSFDFNTGGLADSTLRRLLNAGDYAGAADQFLRWDKAGGKTLAGLTRRRKSERNLFLGRRPFIVPA